MDADNSHISVTDALNNERTVLTSDAALYNNMCREYLFTSKDPETAPSGNLYSSSYAVVHLIDRPLFYSADQLKPMDWTPGGGIGSGE